MLESGSSRRPASPSARYLLYAIGEIALVVIGILIALQINNWNELRKSKDEFTQSMLALTEDIKKDTTIIKNYIKSLEKQEEATSLLIPVLESGGRNISDSLEFIAAFMELSNATNMDMSSQIWDDIRTTANYKRFFDPEVIKAIENYYHLYRRRAANWENGYRTRIEMRELKYSFLSQSDLDLIRSRPPQIPSKDAFLAITNELDVLTLSKSIKHTSEYFGRNFRVLYSLAAELITLLEAELAKIE